MGALPRPDVPEGPVRFLSDRLHELHHRAGWPSLRVMAREVGCSHTTIAAAFSASRVPRWGLLELIVETLDGNTASFHRWWLEASGDDGGPASASTEPLPPESPLTPVIPRQLPASVPGFVGRERELEVLDALSARDPDGPRVAVVVGTAGVGKTALVLTWAHRASSHFPDGQLYLDLRGFDPGTPLFTGEALEMLLRSLGVQGSAVPHETSERAAVYRSLLADRRVLVVLDNAHREEQVRDLVPGNPECLVLVTSRTSMAALVAREGALRINVDLLADGEARDLLRGLVGARIDADPVAADRLARECARLPLALRIAAELAASRPAVSLARLADELADEPLRLDMLRVADDEHTAVRGVFSWSWRHLDHASTHAFRLLGLHAGPEVGLMAAAALLDEEPRSTQVVLGRLIQANLLNEALPDRFSMHDLLRGYALEQAALLDTDMRERALARLERHYLSTSRVAMKELYGSSWSPVRSSGRTADDDSTPVSDPDSARAWLAGVWDAVVAQALSCDAARFAFAANAAATFAEYLDDAAHFDDAYRLHTHVRGLAAEVRRHDVEADSINSLAVVLRRLGRYDEATTLHEQALSIYRTIGDIPGVARSLHRLGVLGWRRGRYAESQRHLEEATGLFARVGDAAGEGVASYALGIAHRRQGNYSEALARHGHAIDLLRRVADRRGEAAAQSNMGVVCMFLGRYAAANEHFEAALGLHMALAHPIGAAVSVDNLGSVASREGRFEDARQHHLDALRVFETLGYPAGQGDSHRGLGVALAGLGRLEEARDELEMALDVGEAVGEADVVIQSLCDLGSLRLARDELDAAEAAWTRARGLASNAGDRYNLARSLAGLAELGARRGDAEMSMSAAQRARQLFAELGVAESTPGTRPVGDLPD